jgi:hypothetical protein
VATTDPTRTHRPGPALYYLDRRWIASCPTCGYELVTARSQARVERKAKARACPVCVQAATP